MKRVGIILFIVGMFLPILSYPFTKLTEDAQGLRTYALMRGGTYSISFRELEVSFADNIVLEYKYVLFAGLLVSLVGILLFTQLRKH